METDTPPPPKRKTAMSPRTPPPKLRSSNPTSPTDKESLYQAVALGRGYTVKAGKATRNRLRRGVPKYVPRETQQGTSEQT